MSDRRMLQIILGGVIVLVALEGWRVWQTTQLIQKGA